MICQVWIDDPPRQDAVSAVRAARSRPQTARFRSAGTSRDIRPAGVHALLVSVTAREAGGEAQNITQSIQSRVKVDLRMVPAQPASTAGDSTPHPVPEADRSLRLLRNHGQLRWSVRFPMGGDRYLAEVALAASPQGNHCLGPVHPDAGTVLAPASQSGPLGVPSRSDFMT